MPSIAIPRGFIFLLNVKGLDRLFAGEQIERILIELVQGFRCWRFVQAAFEPVDAVE